MKILTAILITLILQGCATPYSSQGFMGGFTESRLDSNVFIVNFKGNGFTSSEKAKDYTLLRSAELALEHGYSYFVVTDSLSYNSNVYMHTPTTVNTSASAYGNRNYVYGQATTTVNGGDIITVAKPNESAVVVMFREKPEGVFSYNAKFLVKELKKNYGIK
jgi:hypothetical protein